MKECTTHFHACDCREAAHKAEIAALNARLEESFRDKDTLYRWWRKALYEKDKMVERFAVEIGEAQESNEELTVEIATLQDNRDSLLEALKEWAQAWQEWEDTGIPKTPEESKLIFKNGMAAIAKAEGGQQ